jgi:hypothetical protein
MGLIMPISEAATKYLAAALSASDYYVSERGMWGSNGAERLRLETLRGIGFAEPHGIAAVSNAVFGDYSKYFLLFDDPADTIAAKRTLRPYGFKVSAAAEPLR